ncbi:MAG: UPF0236 family protein [Chloroflexi bacterium]|nr:UPF0236 family protein [Chloroflexota bacterium]
MTTGKKKRHKGKQRATLLTVNGRIDVWRIRWHCPQEGSETPADRWLDEAERVISEGVREMACRLNQGSTSFEKTAENLARAAHLSISKEALRQLIEGEGKVVLRALQRAELQPQWTAEECRTTEGISRMYLGCDGVKVPLVTEEEKQKRRAKTREKRRRRGRRCRPLPRAKTGADQSYKEFRVANFYDETMEHRYVGVTSGNHEAAGRLMQRMACQLELPKAQEKVANVDGAPWIRNQIEFHGLVDAIGLDFYHLRENLQKSRRIVFGEESPEGKAWLDGLMHTFRHVGYDAAWDQLVGWRASLRSPAKRKEGNRLTQYVAERQPMIRYPEFRRRGWQIGSGPTESECKTTTHRIKGRGRRWDSDNAEAMMALACLDDSRMWRTYWTTLNPARN